MLKAEARNKETPPSSATSSPSQRSSKRRQPSSDSSNGSVQRTKRRRTNVIASDDESSNDVPGDNSRNKTEVRALPHPYLRLNFTMNRGDFIYSFCLLLFLKLTSLNYKIKTEAKGANKANCFVYY